MIRLCYIIRFNILNDWGDREFCDNILVSFVEMVLLFNMKIYGID